MNVTQDWIKERLSYDPESGWMTWKTRPESDFPSSSSANAWNARFSGKRAGSVHAKGTGYQRRNILCNGVKYAEHRLIWIYMTGEQPPAEIDHLNRDATDNRWKNLRDAGGKNQRNKSMQRNNSSGATGVSRSKQTGKWVAQYWMDGTNHTIGHFTMKYKAIEALEEFRAKNGYSEGHGESLAPYRRESAI